MRILIAEDKRALAGHMGRALEGEGHSVTFAYDGEEALRLGKTNNFDLLLLDVMLPRKDGFSVIRKMREDRLRTQTIIASARDSMQDIVCGLDAGRGRLSDQAVSVRCAAGQGKSGGAAASRADCRRRFSSRT